MLTRQTSILSSNEGTFLLRLRTVEEADICHYVLHWRKIFIMFPGGKEASVYCVCADTGRRDITAGREGSFFNSSDTGGKKTKSLLMLNHILTAWSCVPLEKMLVAQLFKKFKGFYKLITVFITTPH